MTRDVRCPSCDRYLVYPDVAQTRQGHLGVTETLATCSCGVAAWVRTSPTGRPLVICFSASRPLVVRRSGR